MTRKVGFNTAKPATAPTDNAAWDGILDAGERILWQGRPDSAISIGPKNIAVAIFGCFFAGFALFWMAMAYAAGGFFWMFGLLHFALGASIILFALCGSAFIRKRTWYTLTNKRAFIATQLPIKGKGLKSYPITNDTPLDFRDDTLATIYFSQVTKRGKNGTYTVNVGFERIADGRKVYGLLRKVQEGHA